MQFLILFAGLATAALMPRNYPTTTTCTTTPNYHEGYGYPTCASDWVIYTPVPEACYEMHSKCPCPTPPPVTKYETKYEYKYEPTTVTCYVTKTEYKPTTEYCTKYETKYETKVEYKPTTCTEYKTTTEYCTTTKTEYCTTTKTVNQCEKKDCENKWGMKYC